MTASQIPFEPGAFTTPVVDYEPPPFGIAALAGRATSCPAPSSAALHRRRLLRPVDRVVAEPSPPRAAAEVAPPPSASEVAPPPSASEVAPPPAVFTFADAALRRVLEVIDRRRPMAQLRPLLTPQLLDMVFALTRTTAGPDKAAVLRRVRLRTAAVADQEPYEPLAAEVFATYTRGRRVRAIAGRIEFERCDQRGGRWRLVALHIG